MDKITSEYRLPKSIVPVNYDVILKLDADAFTTNNFQGEVNITLNVLKRTDQILIHSKNLDIISVNLRKPNENFNLTHRSYMSDALTDILTITSENQLSPGFYYLDITYNATFNPYDMHGFYKSTYPNEEGKTEFLATTQFEVTNARRAFPCFDEPSFKATFNLSVVYPKGYNVIANTLQNGNVNVTSENLEIVNFKTTPRMSTYLNAFVISNFTCDTVETKLPFRVCSRAEAANERKYALDISPKLMNYLENFTGIPYNVSGIGKMDQVAIPDFSAGAMENWGLITYRESTLLWDPNESSNLYKQRVASVIAHEFAHMWFGNLVTLKWWSDVYLSEGFARYFQYFATDRIETEWEMDKQFVVEQVHSALFTDSFSASEALSSPVTTPKEISSKFDLISYNKGTHRNHN
ncbi:Peptidase M1 domain containing protein [Asbolus verrucosus]|uniref:Peptidase M1 domain containing protein n=1 Tax=Asbolus verrucosus TaxID=1661398 RepID=A0A482V984_ASBVE|nr:Peptidase M1 domain containing protein [Asbolus verrucosus]